MVDLSRRLLLFISDPYSLSGSSPVFDQIVQSSKFLCWSSFQSVSFEHPWRTGRTFNRKLLPDSIKPSVGRHSTVSFHDDDGEGDGESDGSDEVEIENEVVDGFDEERTAGSEAEDENVKDHDRFSEREYELYETKFFGRRRPPPSPRQASSHQQSMGVQKGSHELGGGRRQHHQQRQTLQQQPQETRRQRDLPSSLQPLQALHPHSDANSGRQHHRPPLHSHPRPRVDMIGEEDREMEEEDELDYQYPANRQPPTERPRKSLKKDSSAPSRRYDPKELEALNSDTRESVMMMRTRHGDGTGTYLCIFLVDFSMVKVDDYGKAQGGGCGDSWMCEQTSAQMTKM